MQRKTSKAKYRLRNWREYNAALIRRGSLTLWVSEETLKAWHDAARPGKRGAPRTYSDVAISGMASLSAVYRLALRATQGLAFFGAETAQGGTAGANLYDLVSAAPEACSESIAARQR